MCVCVCVCVHVCVWVFKGCNINEFRDMYNREYVDSIK